MKRYLITNIEMHRESLGLPAGIFAYSNPNSDSDPMKGRH
jgi:hypothetical protein